MSNQRLKHSKGPAAEEDWLWLCAIPGLYWKHRATLLRYFGSPGAVRRAEASSFQMWEKLGLSWVRGIYPALQPDFLPQVKERMARDQVRFISCEHPAFPKQLAHICDSPHGLFVKGRLMGEEPAREDAPLFVGIVGARACSAYGANMAAAIAREIAQAGGIVVSGMASGIDGIAQRAAIKAGGETYAVLGCGADLCYPRSNLPLYLDLPANGGILSEYPCGTQALARHFPLRNRIISGLVDVLIVVEARRKSGSLITAGLALDQGREVYALPGRTEDPLSAGCNALIADGAGLITSAEGLLMDLQVRFPGRLRTDCAGGPKAKRGQKEAALSKSEGRIYALLGQTPVGITALLGESGLDPGTLHQSLLSLQLKGIVREVGKGRFVKTI